MAALFILLSLLASAEPQLLEAFGLSTGNTGTVAREPFHDIASQSAGLLNYLMRVQSNPDNDLMKKLKQPLPQVNFVDGLPVLPGLLGSLPGAGACLPRDAPLVKQRSPSFFQNVLRNIPGAQDYLSSFLPHPAVDVNALFGKYMWAIDTPSVHDRFCPTTELLPATKSRSGNSSAFSMVEKFRTESEDGAEKTAFGYGVMHGGTIFIYFQDDPCPYQIVSLGPPDSATGQYEYIILSNWARFPVIGLVRDLRIFYDKFRQKMEDDLEREGFTNAATGSTVIHYTDWSKCRKKTPVSYLRNVLSELFGK